MMQGYMASQQQISIVENFLDPKPVLDEIYQFLRCIEYVEENGLIVEKKLSDPLINKEGMPVIMACIKSHINKSSVQANLEENQIKVMLTELNIDIIQLIASRWQEYEIKKQHFDLIVDNIDHQVEAFLSRTKNDGERERFKVPGIKIENPDREEEARRII